MLRQYRFHFVFMLIAATSFVLAATGLTHAQGKGPGGAAPPPTAVETATPTVGVLADTIDVVGTLRAGESIVVRPEVAGRIEAVLFEEGQKVAKGAALFRLDAGLARADLAEAEANSANSQRELKRAQEMIERKLIAPADVDTKRAQAKVDEARLASSKTRIDKTEIRAPFAAITGLRKVSPGAYVNIGDPLVDLVQADPLKVDFSVPETYLGKMREKQDVRVRVDAFPGESFKGQVYAIAPQIDLATRSLALRANLPNADGRLKPGQFAHVDLEVGSKGDALMIPEQALWPQGDKQYVYLVKDGKAALTEVTTGQRKPGMVEILTGLTASDVVITAGQQKIGPGAPVQSVTGANKSDKPAADGSAPHA